MTSPATEPAPIGLPAHEAVLARELSLLNLPAKPWLTPRQVNDRTVLDVAIIGGGLSGLCAAAALRFLGVRDVVVMDRAPAGREGPWVTFARMRTLRTAKEVTGPALGVPSLTPRAWFEAQHGAAVWAALDRIPRTTWMDYLNWYRRVLDLPVRNDTAVTSITPRADGLLELVVASPTGGETMLARRVVLATGLDGLGAPFVPAVAQGVDRRFWAHSSDAIDFAALRGKRVGVVGAGASAMDNAATALEAGAAAVEVLIRRATMPTVDKFTGIGSKGATHGFLGLPPDSKWTMFRLGAESPLPAPRHSVLRVSQHSNARFHLGSPVLSLAPEAGALRVTTPKADYALDFVIFATGFAIDPAARPELAALAPHIRCWGDGLVPPDARPDVALAASPDLGPAFELQEKQPGSCPALRHVHAFNYPAVLSHGKLTSGIPSVSDGAQRLAQGLVRSLFVEDRDGVLAAFRAFDVPELRGDEWVNADAVTSGSEPAHA